MPLRFLFIPFRGFYVTNGLWLFQIPSRFYLIPVIISKTVPYIVYSIQSIYLYIIQSIYLLCGVDEKLRKMPVVYLTKVAVQQIFPLYKNMS